MKKWTIEVEEVRHVTVLYMVEARTKAEAIEKAEAGETIKETEIKNHGVMDRHVSEDPELVRKTR